MYTLYIKPTCPHSLKAINILNARNSRYDIIDVSKLGGTLAVVHAMKENGFIPKATKHNTVPIVFGPKGTFIGGCTELMNYLGVK